MELNLLCVLTPAAKSKGAINGEQQDKQKSHSIAQTMISNEDKSFALTNALASKSSTPCASCQSLATCAEHCLVHEPPRRFNKWRMDTQ